MSSLGHRGPDLEGRPRGGRPGGESPLPSCQRGLPPRRWRGKGITSLKPPALHLGLGGTGEGSKGEPRGRRRRWVEVGTQAKPRRPGAKRSWRAGEEEEQVPVVQAVLSPGRGWTLTRESFDGLHRPVLVGAVHEGIAGFDQELAAVGDLVLRKHFLQVRRGHALVEIADVQLVHGGGLGQDAVPGKAERTGAGGEPPRPRREAAAADTNFLCTPPLKLSGAGAGRAAGGRAEVAGEFGEAREKCPRRAGRRTTRRGSFPSVRNPSERAGVSRFSAAALAPPLNKIDLKKNGAEKKKKKRQSHVVKAPTHPAGEDPRRLRALGPSNPAQPTKLPPGGGGLSTHPPGKLGRRGLLSCSSTCPLPLPRIWPLGRRPAPPTHPSPYPGPSWGRVVQPKISLLLRRWVKCAVIFHSSGLGWGGVCPPYPS